MWCSWFITYCAETSSNDRSKRQSNSYEGLYKALKPEIDMKFVDLIVEIVTKWWTQKFIISFTRNLEYYFLMDYITGMFSKDVPRVFCHLEQGQQKQTNK